MRLPAALATASVVLAAALVPLAPVVTASAQETRTAPQIAQESRSAAADRLLLAQARELLTGSGSAALRRGVPGQEAGEAPAREATLVLRDLRGALPRLADADRHDALALLARPTDRRADPQGTGYTTRSHRRCRGHFCVHHVKRTSDRATSAWVDRTLKVMGRVWAAEVDDLGYDRPLSDGGLKKSRNGGNGKFDVYLADVGAEGVYGYCAADFALRQEPTRAGGYCVLDNDFSSEQFQGKPAKTLAVTAAHEFFHAVQFGYDLYEDRWFLESTATWVEERFADGVNDNRQYLRYGQVGAPGTPLDRFDRSGFTHYGNWPFWEHLSLRYGDKIVRRVWEAARGEVYSTRALERVLERRGGFAKRYAEFAAANLTPSRSYPEGEHWPTQRLEGSWTLGRSGARSDDVDIDHMAAASYLFTPDTTVSQDGLAGAPYRLRITIDGPRPVSAPTAWLVVRTVEGEWRSEQVVLDDSAAATVTTPFTTEKVRAVSVTLVNASTRFRCDRDSPEWSCSGLPRDEDRPFSIGAEVYTR